MHRAHDIFDVDNGIVDQNTRDDGDGEEADEVEGEAGGRNGPKGGNGR